MLISGFVLIVIALGNEERETGLILYPGLILSIPWCRSYALVDEPLPVEELHPSGRSGAPSI